MHLFNIAIDIEKYPDFVPWCNAVLILAKKENFITAEVLASFKLFSGRYTCNITFSPPTEQEIGWIEIISTKGIFKHLKSKWEFLPQTDTQDKTLVKFFIDFEFKSKIFQKALSLVYKNSQKKIISAFKKTGYFTNVL